MDKVEMLKSAPLFAGLKDKQLKLIAGTAKVLTFNEGEPIIEEGNQRSIGFYVLGSGSDGVSLRDLGAASAEVTKGDTVVASYGPGDYFGEIALLTDDQARTATVSATSDSEVLGLTKWDFRALLNSNPDIAVEVMAELARRLDETQASNE